MVVSKKRAVLIINNVLLGIGMKNHNRKQWVPPRTSVQAKALAFVRKNCKGRRAGQQLHVTVNLHPDKKTKNGTPILLALKVDGALKSQFETGTSNGGLSAFPGGARWRWEYESFGGLYDNSDPAERPKYGTLNYRNLRSGGSPRFGSSCLLLKPHILARTTFCYPESYFGPSRFGVDDSVADLIELADTDDRDLLDNYIEAHIHGPVFLESDVEALVLDPAFKDTDVETLARGLPFRTEWHQGFRLSIDVVEKHADYRGQEFVDLARALAVRGHLNPAILGEVVEKQKHDPQDVKKVWHYLARFGDRNRMAE